MEENNRYVYFAHCQLTYNTNEEARILRFLEKKFGCRVICPNRDIGETGDIEDYLAAVSVCEVVVATRFPLKSKYLSVGVFKELSFALKQGKIVYVVEDKKNLRLLPVKNIRKRKAGRGYASVYKWGIINIAA